MPLIDVPDLNDMKSVKEILQPLSAPHVKSIYTKLLGGAYWNKDESIDDLQTAVNNRQLSLMKLRKAVCEVVGNYKLAVYTNYLRRSTGSGDIVSYLTSYLTMHKKRPDDTVVRTRLTFGDTFVHNDGVIESKLDLDHPFYTNEYKSRYTDDDGILLAWKLALARRGWRTVSSDIYHGKIFFHPLSWIEAQSEIRRIYEQLRSQERVYVIKGTKKSGFRVQRKYE